MENLAKPPMLRAPGALSVQDCSPWGIASLFPPTSSRTPQKHPQGPPAPHGGLRMHLLGHNLVPFIWSEKKSPQYLPDLVKVQFFQLWRGTCTQPPSPRAHVNFPELSPCCQPHCSAPHQVPIVCVPCWWHLAQPNSS